MQLFKDALNDALLDTGKTPAGLADAIKVGRSRISEFTLGKSLPKDDTLIAICDQLPSPTASKLAKAWVRERLGTDLSDSILAQERLTGTELELLHSALPDSTAAAFLILIRTARDDADFRATIENLAAFLTPTPKPPPPAGDQDGGTTASDRTSPHDPEPPFRITRLIGDKFPPSTPSDVRMNEDIPPPTPPPADQLAAAKRRVQEAAAKLKS